jgi:hypothetical protein
MPKRSDTTPTKSRPVSELTRLKDLAHSKGRKLKVISRASDGRLMYAVTHGNQLFTTSHLHDVLGHLNALEGAEHG